jgi:ferric-dicitrate binding protein FerR (iron transport regulator)
MTGDRTPMHASLDGLDPVLCDRYLADECTPDELQQIDRWIAGDAARRAALWKLRRGLAVPMAYPMLEFESEIVAWVNTKIASEAEGKRAVEQHRVASTATAHGVVKRWNRERRPLYRALRYAFAGAVVGAVLLMVGQWSKSRRMHATLATHTLTYTTAKGQRATITLPDGSTVILNVASQLQVPADYAAGNPALRLTGEALFTVVPNARRAVTVTSGGVTTRVLGTSFLVRHYGNDIATVVAVREGKVAVRSQVLAGMQQSEFTAQGATAVQTANASLFSFATGMLTLDDMPLHDAVVELSRWYDLDIRLGDASLATRRIGGVFAAGAQSDLMTFLEESMHLRVAREGHVVILYPRADT